jgi:hypothetical protein
VAGEKFAIGHDTSSELLRARCESPSAPCLDLSHFYKITLIDVWIGHAFTDHPAESRWSDPRDRPYWRNDWRAALQKAPQFEWL